MVSLSSRQDDALFFGLTVSQVAVKQRALRLLQKIAVVPSNSVSASASTSSPPAAAALASTPSLPASAVAAAPLASHELMSHLRTSVASPSPQASTSTVSDLISLHLVDLLRRLVRLDSFDIVGEIWLTYHSIHGTVGSSLFQRQVRVRNKEEKVIRSFTHSFLPSLLPSPQVVSRSVIEIISSLERWANQKDPEFDYPYVLLSHCVIVSLTENKRARMLYLSAANAIEELVRIAIHSKLQK